MLSVLDLPLSEAVYTFVEHGGTPTHIAASSLQAAWIAAGGKPGLALMSPPFLAALERGDLGVEPDHAMRLPEAALEAPALVCLWGDAHVIADGAHRIWRRWKRGDRDFPAYWVPERIWRLFTIRDMPGDGDFWRDMNKEEWRTPEAMALLRLLGGE